jgi:hypothetical protein
MHSHFERLCWPPCFAPQCRAELAKIDLLVVPTSAYNYTVQEIQVGGLNARRPGIFLPACTPALAADCLSASPPPSIP